MSGQKTVYELAGGKLAYGEVYTAANQGRPSTEVNEIAVRTDRGLMLLTAHEDAAGRAKLSIHDVAQRKKWEIDFPASGYPAVGDPAYPGGPRAREVQSLETYVDSIEEGKRLYGATHKVEKSRLETALKGRNQIDRLYQTPARAKQRNMPTPAPTQVRTQTSMPQQHDPGIVVRTDDGGMYRLTKGEDYTTGKPAMLITNLMEPDPKKAARMLTSVNGRPIEYPDRGQNIPGTRSEVASIQAQVSELNQNRPDPDVIVRTDDGCHYRVQQGWDKRTGEPAMLVTDLMESDPRKASKLITSKNGQFPKMPDVGDAIPGVGDRVTSMQMVGNPVHPMYERTKTQNTPTRNTPTTTFPTKARNTPAPAPQPRPTNAPVFNAPKPEPVLPGMFPRVNRQNPSAMPSHYKQSSPAVEAAAAAIIDKLPPEMRAEVHDVMKNGTEKGWTAYGALANRMESQTWSKAAAAGLEAAYGSAPDKREMASAMNVLSKADSYTFRELKSIDTPRPSPSPAKGHGLN